MIDWSTVSLRQALETYAVSNTASFLYSKFRRDQNIVDLGKSNPLAALLEELKRLLEIESWTAEQVVQAYAILVAMTYTDIAAVKDALRSINLGRMRWAHQIVSLAEADFVPSNSLYLPYQPAVSTSTLTTVSSSTTISKHSQ